MSKTTASDFTWTYTEQPHRSRRKAILAAHPEVKELFGHDPCSKYWVTFEVLLQLATAWFMQEQPWWLIVIVAYAWGGTINHSLYLANHELSHNLFFDNPLHNTLFGFILNLPIPVALTVTFQKYHVLHHRYLGESTMDPDLPKEWEGKWSQSPVTKFLFLCAQPFLYTLRPLLLQPMPMGGWEVAQWVYIVIIDALVVHFWSFKAFAYLLASSILGSSFHPMAGHMVAEHYEWAKGQETFSYYGFLNKIAYNTGYHNEHHDFPRVPWTRLPELKRIAPEFYDSIRSVDWLRVMWQFIFDPTISPFSRTVRDTLTKGDHDDRGKPIPPSISS